MKEKTIFALGFFDGVHLGHQALLSACKTLAAQHGCRAGVLTFAGHPDTLVLGNTPALLNTPQDRRQLLTEYGMDTVVELPFDRELMCCPWQTFFRRLVEEFGAAGLVCGEDFRFGHKGEGTADTLSRACREEGLPCAIVAQQKLDGTVISSTHIRALLETGDMEETNRFLGHPHMLTGEVVAGRQIGRTMGIPTANLVIPQELAIPKLGVYACLACFDGHKYPAVANIGTRPTVSGTGVSCEVHLLDFAGNLYGRQLKVEFHTFLRPERKFPDLGQLQEEIRKNIEETLRFFGKK